MGVNIGNNNKINNSTIAEDIQVNQKEDKSFIGKHPVISSFLISLVAGLVLMFSFWNNFIEWMEGLF
ncbi:hypothetical protein [Faecalibacillus intestinalis]|uniref:hypothetical protein n=1 Tax=Faecalibacillus intestinalis TaxID=1982626 RepID=UPI0022DEB572|nr:hypothetical protein [Faecalibacillus intestinalis]